MSVSALHTDPALRDAAIALEVEQLTTELLAASIAYRAAKRRFARRTDAYGRGPVAELRARTDYPRQRAGADCEWHGAEMARLGTALLALASVGRPQ